MTSADDDMLPVLERDMYEACMKQCCSPALPNRDAVSSSGAVTLSAHGGRVSRYSVEILS